MGMLTVFVLVLNLGSVAIFGLSVWFIASSLDRMRPTDPSEPLDSSTLEDIP